MFKGFTVLKEGDQAVTDCCGWLYEHRGRRFAYYVASVFPGSLHPPSHCVELLRCWGFKGPEIGEESLKASPADSDPRPVATKHFSFNLSNDWVELLHLLPGKKVWKRQPS